MEVRVVLELIDGEVGCLKRRLKDRGGDGEGVGMVEGGVGGKRGIKSGGGKKVGLGGKKRFEWKEVRGSC